MSDMPWRTGSCCGTRTADGRPITSRRYDHLWVRIGQHLPWWRPRA
jgi:hypothetical protein